jgi:hypothetical protein
VQKWIGAYLMNCWLCKLTLVVKTEYVHNIDFSEYYQLCASYMNHLGKNNIFLYKCRMEPESILDEHYNKWHRERLMAEKRTICKWLHHEAHSKKMHYGE